MKIGIVGSGAMGSVYGALLADAGNELWLFDKWREHIEAMRAWGLRCEGASGDHTVRVNATTDAAAAGPCELAIVATKVMDIETAVREAAAMIGPDTLVLAIQNGLGNVERIRRVLGPHNLCSGSRAASAPSSKSPATFITTAWRRSISPNSRAGSPRGSSAWPRSGAPPASP
jgi:2-dehydropantoate 2-reductase